MLSSCVPQLKVMDDNVSCKFGMNGNSLEPHVGQMGEAICLPCLSALSAALWRLLPPQTL